MMELEKVNYVDKRTPIAAKNLNDIQDAIITLQSKIDELNTSIDALQSTLDNMFITD